MGARAATLSIMVGGDAEAFEKCRQIFEAMGKNIVYQGKAGAGQHTKMANQIALGGAIAGVCEALSYGKKLGSTFPLCLAPSAPAPPGAGR